MRDNKKNSVEIFSEGNMIRLDLNNRISHYLNCDVHGIWSVRIHGVLYVGKTPLEVRDAVYQKLNPKDTEGYDKGYREASKEYPKIRAKAFRDGYKRAIGDVVAFGISKGKGIKEDIRDMVENPDLKTPEGIDQYMDMIRG